MPPALHLMSFSWLHHLSPFSGPRFERRIIHSSAGVGLPGKLWGGSQAWLLSTSSTTIGARCCAGPPFLNPFQPTLSTLLVLRGACLTFKESACNAIAAFGTRSIDEPASDSPKGRASSPSAPAFSIDPLLMKKPVYFGCRLFPSMKLASSSSSIKSSSIS